MDIVQARTNMITQQCRAGGVFNQEILSLFEKIPREDFVPKHYQKLAFADMPIPLGHEQYMLTPSEEARILDNLKLSPNERVLEIGTGSGYFTALLAHQSKCVDSVDIFEDFTTRAAQKLLAHKIHNIDLQTTDALAGYKKNTHYDVIVITGALLALPKNFLKQLNPGGRLFAFLGKVPVIQASLITKTSATQQETRVLFETVVAPLVNTQAHKNSEFIF